RPQSQSSSIKPARRWGLFEKRLARPTLESLETRALPSATLWTDKPDYAPGTTAIINGAGFQVGETVQLQITNIAGLPNPTPPRAPWDVTDGYTGPAFQDAAGIWHLPDLDGKVDGNIQTSWTMDASAVNSTMQLTATGLSSALTATMTFTDKDFVGADP